MACRDADLSPGDAYLAHRDADLAPRDADLGRRDAYLAPEDADLAPGEMLTWAPGYADLGPWGLVFLMVWSVISMMMMMTALKLDTYGDMPTHCTLYNNGIHRHFG